MPDGGEQHVSDLIEFLRARLDEDERNARDHLCLNCGNPVVPLGSALGITGYTHEGGRANAQGVWEQGWEGQRCPGKIVGAEPVQNPARVLAEVEAKREVVRLAVQARRNADLPEAEFAVGPSGATYFVNGFAAAMEHAVRLFAQANSDHPDYRPEWAPERIGT